MKTLALTALLALSACVESRETLVLTRQRDLDQKLFNLEQLRLQRDQLETQRLQLWSSAPAPAPTYITPPRRGRR